MSTFEGRLSVGIEALWINQFLGIPSRVMRRRTNSSLSDTKNLLHVAQVGGGARLQRQRSEGSGSFKVEAAGSKTEDREKNELAKEESRCDARVSARTYAANAGAINAPAARSNITVLRRPLSLSAVVAVVVVLCAIWFTHAPPKRADFLSHEQQLATAMLEDFGGILLCCCCRSAWSCIWAVTRFFDNLASPCIMYSLLVCLVCFDLAV